jgi:hypothetical protein
VQNGGGGRSKTTTAAALKFDPGTVAPVTAPFVLAPPIFVVFALFPSPTIGMNRNPVFRTVFMPHLDMPAITLAVANNLCRCSGGSQGQRASGPEDSVGQTLQKHTPPLWMSCFKNTSLTKEFHS